MKSKITIVFEADVLDDTELGIVAKTIATYGKNGPTKDRCVEILSITAVTTKKFDFTD